MTSLFVIRLGLVIVSVKRFHQAKATERTLGREPPSNKKEVFTTSLFVIRLGLEPKTPTLKVLCSTN